MGRNRSLVWNFFDRVTEDGKTSSVECKLCETEYKYFGNTTNLKQHLVRRHPIQWEISESGGLSETARKRLEDADEKDVRYICISNDDKTSKAGTASIEISRHDTIDNSDIEHETDRASAHLVREVRHRESDEEWLEEPFQTSHIETFEIPMKRPKSMKIKKERESPARLRRPRIQSMQPYDDKSSEHIFIPADHLSVKDELSVFGEYVANKMRKFKSPRTRGNLQQVITTMLWQAEYGMYDNSDAVKRILMMPVETEQSNINVTLESVGETSLQGLKNCYQELMNTNVCEAQNDKS